MRAFAGIAVLSLLLAGCVTVVSTAPQLAPKKVWEVQRYLKELHGQTVRLQGEIDECMSLTCKICDGPAEDDACLPLSLAAADGNEKDVLEQLYRFATVTVDARIDASCQIHYDPSIYKSEEEASLKVICTDRSGALEDAHVVSVESRKPATQALFHRYGGEPVAPLAARDALDVLDKLKGPLRYLFDDQWPQAVVFREPSYDDEDADDADVADQSGLSYWVCYCTEDECSGRWPKRTGDFVKTPANPYLCFLGSEKDGAWLILF